MNQDRKSSGQSADPEDRAFTGGADMPPAEPDQPAEGNQELLREEEEENGGSGGKKPDEGHGDYGNLPGYGG